MVLVVIHRSHEVGWDLLLTYLMAQRLVWFRLIFVLLGLGLAPVSTPPEIQLNVVVGLLIFVALLIALFVVPYRSPDDGPSDE